MPERCLTNDALEQMVETSSDWIVQRTGIRERRVVKPGQGTSHMAAEAAAKALTTSGLNPEDVDLVIVATSTPDLAFPPVSSLVQRHLGLDRATAFDVNGVCAGFLNAMVIGSQFIESGAYAHVLVIGADTLSRIVDYTDRNTCVLFGDGAGAVLLGASTAGDGLLDFDLHSDGKLAGLATCALINSPQDTLSQLEIGNEPYIRQQGKTIFKVAVQSMGASLTTVLARNGLSVSDISVLVPHQANQRILDALGDRMGINPDRVASCLEYTGNTSASSIPLALDHRLQNHPLQEGDLVAFAAFAGGLLWGSALLRWGSLVL